MKRLTIKSVEQKLMEDGNFEGILRKWNTRKRLTDKGQEFGIRGRETVGVRKGNEYEDVLLW